MKHFFRYLWMLFFLLAPVAGLAAEESGPNIFLAPRQLIMIKPGINSLWGNLVLAVHHRGEEGAPAQEFAFKIVLPKEINDFQPQEGLEPQDVAQDEQGALQIKKSFPPGTHVITIAFMVPAKGGMADLTYQAFTPLQQLTVLLQRGDLNIASSNLAPAQQNTDRQYDAYETPGAVNTGDVITMRIGGVPEDRKNLLTVGLVAGAFLMVGGVAGAMVTRPARRR